MGAGIELSPGTSREVSRKETLPSSVDFMLLGQCNLRCSFCFGPQHEIPAMETGKVKSIIQAFSRNGVERVVFTGGEPTLIRDLPEILSEAKKVGLFTVLSTNGLKLDSDPSLLEKLVPSLDWIALSLDGSTSEVNAKMRVGLTPEIGLRHFGAVLRVVQRIRTDYPQLKIKIGTVVAKPNLRDVHNIPFSLRDHAAIPDTWKLYQISPSEYGKINYSELEISDDEFEGAFVKARENAREVEIKNVAKYTNAARPGKYLFINPLGEALIVDPENNDYRSIGNILNTPKKVLTGWQIYIDQNLLSKNFEDTYSMAPSL